VNTVQTETLGWSRRLSERLRAGTVVERALVVLWVVVGGLAVLYAVFFLAHLHASIISLLWNSDYASGFTLTETLSHFGSEGNTVISTTGAWADLWFGLLTAHLSFHRQLWEISPAILYLFSAVVVGRSVWRVANLAGGVLATLIVLLASPWMLAIVLAPVAHNTVYPATAVLGGWLPWLLRRGRRHRLVWAAVIVLGAVLLGIDIASDKLIVVAGVVPLGLIGLAAVAQRQPETRTAGIVTLVTILLSIPVALVTDAIMKAAGYRIIAPKLALAPLSEVGFHFRLLWHGLRDLAGGYLGSGYPGTLHPELGFACTVVLAIGLLALIRGGLPALITLARRRSAEDELPDRLFHLSYWLVSAVVVIAAFVFTNAVGDGKGNHESYFLTIVFSIAAVAPLTIRTGTLARWVAPVVLGLFAIGSFVGVKESYINVYRPPLLQVASTIVRLARADDATTGYAGYWDASNLTWSEKGAVVVRPLEQCANPNPQGSDICPFFLMRNPAWYRPEPRRTFLLVDPTNLYVISLPNSLGAPIATYHLGAVTMYVYGYDIASKLGPFPAI
jgi:hypothetical protein